MDLRSLLLFWLFFVPALTDTTIGSVFEILEETDSDGGCESRLALLETWLSECKDMVQAGMQVFDDASSKSNTHYEVAWRYLTTYFYLKPDSPTKDVAFVKTSLQEVQNFLNGRPTAQDSTPRLFCDDKWLEKLERSDVAYNGDSSKELMAPDANNALSPVAIEDVRAYQYDLWDIDADGSRTSNGQVPYWSELLNQYVFDSDYGGKTYCTVSKNENLGATQDRTKPSTVTLCPFSFTNTRGSAKLGSKSPKGQQIGNVLPRSATLYHELFHLVLTPAKTPDVAYLWKEQGDALKAHDIIPEEYEDLGMTNAELIRRNPETYVWFSVGYWYFLQTTWSSETNQRYSFHSGKAELVKL